MLCFLSVKNNNPPSIFLELHSTFEKNHSKILELVKDSKFVASSRTNGEDDDSITATDDGEGKQIQFYKKEYTLEGTFSKPLRKRDIIRDKLLRKSYTPTTTNTSDITNEELTNNNNLKEVYEIVAKVEEGLLNYQKNFPKLDGFPSHYLPSFVSLRHSIQNSNKSPNNNDDLIIKDSQKREIIYCCFTEFIQSISIKHSQSHIAVRFIFNSNDLDRTHHCITEYVSQFQKVHLLFFQIYKELKQLIQMLEIEINATAEEHLTKSLLLSNTNAVIPKVNCSNKILDLAKSSEKSFVIFEQWDHKFHSLFDQCKKRMEKSLSRYPPY